MKKEMTQKSNSRGRLVRSMLALLLCVAMFVGATWAWFTDTASNTGNKIKAGNLKIDLLQRGENKTYGSIKDQTASIFNSADNANATNATLWEPGATHVAYLAIRNEGNLAIKYNVYLDIKDNGLAGALQYVLIPQSHTMGAEQTEETTTYSTWGEVLTAGGGTATDLGAGTRRIIAAENGCLDEIAKSKDNINETEYFALAVHMKEEAGNEYKEKDIEIDVNVVATQKNAESDSFGPDYDKNAIFVADDKALEEALQNAQPGSVVSMGKGNYKLPTTPIGEGITLAGEGADKTTVTVNKVQKDGIGTTGQVIDKKGISIKNVTLSGTGLATGENAEYCGVVDVRKVGTTLDSVVITNTNSRASSVVIGTVENSEKVTISNSKLNGGFKPIHIVDGTNGTIDINNTEITGTYTFNVNSNSSQNLVINVTDSKLHGWTSYSKIKSAKFVNTEFSKGSSGYDYLRPYADTTLEGCSFDSVFQLGAGGSGLSLVFNNCTRNGAALTADNFKDMIDQDDIANLKGSTIVVNGTTVVLE